MRPRFIKSERRSRLKGDDLYTMNGMGEYAAVYIDLLRGATHQNDLRLGSLYHLRSVISNMKSAAIQKYRRWCPSCLVEMRETDVDIHIPLMWQICIAKYCGKHRLQLREVCPKCGAKQYQVCCLIPLDQCANCGADLCMPSISSIIDTKMNNFEITWVNRNIEELIIAGNTPLEIADSAFARFIGRFLESYGIEYVSKVLTGYSHPTIRQWARARYQPTLPTLFDVCGKANISVALLLREPEIAAMSCQELDLQSETIPFTFLKDKILFRPRKKWDRQSVRDKAKSLLVKLQKGKFISNDEFARMLGIPYGTLRYLAKNELDKLNTRNKQILKRKKRRAKAMALTVIRSSYNEIRKEGGKMSRSNVIDRALSKGCGVSRQRLIDAYATFRVP